MPKVPTLPVTKYSDAAKVIASWLREHAPRDAYFDDVIAVVSEPKHAFVLDTLIVEPLFQSQALQLLDAPSLATVWSAAYGAALAFVLNQKAQALRDSARRAALDLAKESAARVKACFGDGGVQAMNIESACAARSRNRFAQRAEHIRRWGR